MIVIRHLGNFRALSNSFSQSSLRRMSTTPPAASILPEFVNNGNTQPLDPLLLNKSDTEQESLLQKYPTYDGRGILIAILDTGVDPSLPGMLVTTEGDRKIVDVIDCSGAGDVDTSTVKSAKDRVLEGLTGRKLTIPETWTCPTGKYHLGLKPIYELYTKGVKAKVSGEKKEDSYGPLHNTSTAEALKQLTDHETEVGGSSDRISDKWTREDLASKVDFLKSMQNTPDVGPVADVITWHDGNIWRVCIDTSFRGRLSLCSVLGSFKETGDFAFLTDKDSVTYTVRVSTDGNLTEIAVPSGAHGSHVAGIAAANYPENPEKNGLAPGAKLVSLNIGDHRVSAMETGQALTRAFNECARMGVDVINMSFGEGTHLPEMGRIVEEAKRLVERKGVIFVSSAGNAGPALSTVGAPGGTTTGIIGIAAYLTGETSQTLYGVNKQTSSKIYPWSSRGPCPDGKLGVSLCAPAAAFAGVPKYCRQSMQMMNGTSMSSPNAAGNIACMLSGIRQEKLAWTPFSVRMALENTAKMIPNGEVFSTGYGMVQIHAAYDRLLEMLKNRTFPEKLLHFDIGSSEYSKKSKGIYIREPKLDGGVHEISVSVEPKFLNHSEPNNLPSIEFEKQVLLQCDAPWVTHPQTLFMVALARTLAVTVDPSKAPPGASYTEIVGIDAANPAHGPILRIPVTVINPENVRDEYSTKILATSGIPQRRFVRIPLDATCARISLKSSNKDVMDRFTLHTMYLESDRASRNTETSTLHQPAGQEWIKCIRVKGGKTLEACVFRNWASDETHPAEVDMKIEFFGVKKPETLSIIHNSASTQFRIQAANLNSFEISPSISMTSLVVPVKPQSSKVEPLGARDVFLTSGLQIFRTFTTYKLSVQKTCEVRLELAGLTNYLYESPVDCVLFQVFGANKGFIQASGSYPDRYDIKLEKGEYTVQAQIRHPDEQLLEKLKDLTLYVHAKLSSKLAVDLSISPDVATNGKDSKFSGKGLLPNHEMSLYAANISEDKIPKLVLNTPSGSFLRGTLSVFSDAKLSAADKSEVIYYLPEFSTRAAKGLSMVTTKKDKNQTEEMKEAIRDLEVSWVNKLTDEKAAKELFDSCLQKYPDHLPLLQNRVNKIMQVKTSDFTAEHIREAIQLCAKILQLTNPNEVLQFLAIKQEHADDLLTIEKWIAVKGGDEPDRKEVAKIISKFDERKNAIIFALQVLSSFEQDVKLHKSKENLSNNLRFGAITPIIFGGKSDSYNFAKTSDEFKNLKTHVETLDTVIEDELKKVDDKWNGTQFYVKLLVWLPNDDSKALLLSAKQAASLAHFGRCAKFLNKSGEELKSAGTDSKVVDSTLSDICDELGWVHLSTHFKNLALIKNRPGFRLF